MNIEEFDYKGYKIEIIHDEDAQNPRELFAQDQLDTMVCFHHKYDLGDKNHNYKMEDFDFWESLRGQIIQDHDPVAILPLYMYDHSGITISTSYEYPYNDRWDAGQIGFIFMSRKNALINWGKSKKTSNQALKNKVIKFLNASVKEYDLYLRGESYGYVISKNEDEIESCWGFLGFECCKKEAISIVDALAKTEVLA